jgi:hypothetical protein
MLLFVRRAVRRCAFSFVRLGKHLYLICNCQNFLQPFDRFIYAFVYFVVLLKGFGSTEILQHEVLASTYGNKYILAFVTGQLASIYGSAYAKYIT